MYGHKTAISILCRLMAINGPFYGHMAPNTCGGSPPTHPSPINISKSDSPTTRRSMDYPWLIHRCLWITDNPYRE